jgi:hypothetical protein
VRVIQSEARRGERISFAAAASFFKKVGCHPRDEGKQNGSATACFPLRNFSSVIAGDFFPTLPVPFRLGFFFPFVPGPNDHLFLGPARRAQKERRHGPGEGLLTASRDFSHQETGFGRLSADRCSQTACLGNKQSDETSRKEN